MTLVSILVRSVMLPHSWRNQRPLHRLEPLTSHRRRSKLCPSVGKYIEADKPFPKTKTLAARGTLGQHSSLVSHHRNFAAGFTRIKIFAHLWCSPESTSLFPVKCRSNISQASMSATSTRRPRECGRLASKAVRRFHSACRSHEVQPLGPCLGISTRATVCS
jgi:hypothetical protein